MTSTSDTPINIINLIPNRQYTGTVQCSYELVVSWSQCVTLLISFLRLIIKIKQVYLQQNYKILIIIVTHDAPDGTVVGISKTNRIIAEFVIYNGIIIHTHTISLYLRNMFQFGSFINNTKLKINTID